MLSAIGRAATRRAGTGALSVSGRVGESSWQLQRVVIAQHQSNATHAHSSREAQATRSSRRCFATATKAPAKPRAIKAVSTEKSTATKGAAKKKLKKSPKKTPKKKVATKRKPAVKRELTEEQKIRLAKRQTGLAEQKAKLKVQELKKAALFTEPKELPASAWLVIMTEEFEKQQGGDFGGLKVIVPAAGAKYRNLTASEREHYNHLANQNKAANETAYNDWLAKHSPEQIRLANNARMVLRKNAKAKKRKLIPNITDSRLPKRPSNARTIFIKQRWASGDFKGLAFKDSLKTLHEDWNGLPPQEKTRFEFEAYADRQRYNKEYKSVYNRDPPSLKASATASA